METIHISSGQMTDLPEYNIIPQNNIEKISIGEYIVKAENNKYSSSIQMSYSSDNQRIGTSGTVDKYEYGKHIVKYLRGYSTPAVEEYEVNCVGVLFRLNIKNVSFFDGDDVTFDIVKKYTRVENIDVGSGNFQASYVTETNTTNFTWSNVTTLGEHISYDTFDIGDALKDEINFKSNTLYLFLGTQTNNSICCFIILDAQNYNTFINEIDYYGFAIAHNIQEISVVVNVKEYSLNQASNLSGADFSYPSNKLLQNTATKNGEPLADVIKNYILSKWGGGRQIVSLTCIYGIYYGYDKDKDSKNSNVIILDGKDGRMIEVGDIVIPTRLYTNSITNTNYELPIAVDKDGNALEFEVLSSEIEFNNGRLVTHLKLMEVK